MRKALCLALATLCLGLTASASDWVEDEGYSATRAPRPAPDFRRPASSGWQQRQQQDYRDNDDADDSAYEAGLRQAKAAGGHHVHGSGGKARLEGNVSKYRLKGEGQGGYFSGNAMSAFRSAPPGRMQGAVDLRDVPPYVPPVKQSVPPSTFRAWIEKSHPQFALSTSTMGRDRVLEIKGAWDNSDRTIRSLGIPHTTIRAGRLKDYPLDGAQVLVINCAGNVPPASLQRIRDFVAQGGHLLTTDWALDGVLRRAFPGYVEWNGGQTDGGVVDATIMDRDPRLIKGAVLRAGWKLDEASQTVRILNPRRVRVLARSQMLASSGDDPDRQGILAVFFEFGRGQVLHLVGHFDNNSGLAFVNALPDPAPGIGISLRQALAANFLVSALSNAQQPETGAGASGDPVSMRQ